MALHIPRGCLAALVLLTGASAFAVEAPPDASAPAAAPYATPAPAFPLSAYAAFGSVLAQSGHFSDIGWTDAQMNAFLEGFKAAYQGKPYPPDDITRQLAAEVNKRIGELSEAPQAKAPARPQGPAPVLSSAEKKAQLDRYFKDMTKKLGLQISESGLGYNVQPGRNGIRPRPGDTIVFTCGATGADGTTKLPQLSSQNIRTKFEGMLPGLMEGLQMMTVDSHAVFVLPPSLSFGDGEWPEGVPRGSPLVYYIVLHDVVSADAASKSGP